MSLKDLGIGKEALGQALQNARNRARVTQEALAERMGYEDASYLSKIEHGKRTVDVDWVVRYGIALGCGFNCILGEALILESQAKLAKDYVGIPLFELLSPKGQVKIYQDIISMIEYEIDSEERYAARLQEYKVREAMLENKYGKD